MNSRKKIERLILNKICPRINPQLRQWKSGTELILNARTKLKHIVRSIRLLQSNQLRYYSINLIKISRNELIIIVNSNTDRLIRKLNFPASIN